LLLRLSFNLNLAVAQNSHHINVTRQNGLQLSAIAGRDVDFLTIKLDRAYLPAFNLV